jgi:predicted Zn-dependent peptidase
MASTLLHLSISGVDVPVIFHKEDRLPLRNFELIFKDSGFLAGDVAGLASLSAKLLNEGTKERGAIEFAREIENHALSMNIDVGRETLVISLEGLESEFGFGLKKIKELINDPNYTEKAFKKVINERLGKLMQKESNFDYIASLNLKATLFADTPLANPELGRVESIKSITLEMIKGYIDSHLHLNNLIIVAGGKWSEEKLKKDIKELIEALPLGDVKKIPHFKANKKGEEKIVHRDTDQAYIYFGAPFDINSSSEDRVYAKVASFILGSSGFGSRLMEEIRVKRGLAYSAYSKFIINRTHSYLSGYLQTKIESEEKAKSVVVSVVDGFLKDGVTKSELESAKKFFLGSEPLRSETLSQKLNRGFREYYDGVGIDYHKKELKKIEEMKLKDLNRFIKSHPEIGELSFSIVTSKSSK